MNFAASSRRAVCLLPECTPCGFLICGILFSGCSEPHGIAREACPDPGDTLSCGWHAAFVSVVPDLSPFTLLLSFFPLLFFFFPVLSLLSLCNSGILSFLVLFPVSLSAVSLCSPCFCNQDPQFLRLWEGDSST